MKLKNKYFIVSNPQDTLPVAHDMAWNKTATCVFVKFLFVCSGPYNVAETFWLCLQYSNTTLRTAHVWYTTKYHSLTKGNPKHKTKTTKQQRTPLRPSPQLIDVSVYSSSSLEKQPSNGEESCTAVALDNLDSTASQSLYSFHLPIYMYISN
jgi:hypothetical protein